MLPWTVFSWIRDVRYGALRRIFSVTGSSFSVGWLVLGGGGGLFVVVGWVGWTTAGRIISSLWLSWINGPSWTFDWAKACGKFADRMSRTSSFCWMMRSPFLNVLPWSTEYGSRYPLQVGCSSWEGILAYHRKHPFYPLTGTEHHSVVMSWNDNDPHLCACAPLDCLVLKLTTCKEGHLFHRFMSGILLNVSMDDGPLHPL